jgi:two-component system OmpR family response regulator
MCVLMAEDDDRIDETPLPTSLRTGGFDVERECGGEVAWYCGDREAYDAIVLDLGLRGGRRQLVAKPFHVQEIVARLQALVRRSNGLASSHRQSQSD